MWTPRMGDTSELCGSFCMSVLLLTGKDLDIVGSMFVLHKEQCAGQCGSNEREYSKQSFENFHRLILLGG